MVAVGDSVPHGCFAFGGGLDSTFFDVFSISGGVAGEAASRLETAATRSASTAWALRR